MSKYNFEFLIDGQPIIRQDGNVTISYEDLDSEDSGRDESGVMHRIVIRESVRKIPLYYLFLSREDYLYMESLFKGKSSFQVDCRDDYGMPLRFNAYRSKHSITIPDIKSGGYKNYSFSIVEC